MTGAIEQYLSWLVWPCVLAAGVALTGLYCGLETGVYVLNKFRLDLRADEGMRSARMLKRMMDNHKNLLAVLLIGTNLAAYAATFAVTAMCRQAGASDHAAQWYTIAIATPILFIIGESVPKNVFQILAERLVYRLAWVLSVSSVAFRICGISPLVQVFSWLMIHFVPAARRGSLESKQWAFSAIMAEGRASGVLTASQSQMADRVMGISQVTLGDVMVPMESVVSAPADVSRDGLIKLMRECDFSRLPLLDANARVTGILDVYQVLLDETGGRPGDHVLEPLILPATTSITDALSHMRRQRSTMAIVDGDDGKHVGLATIKDLVEEIVGELEAW